MKAILAIPFLLTIVLVAYVQGGFTIWNALPVVLGFGVLLYGLQARSSEAVGCIAFGVSVTLLMALFHLAWLFDWGGTATGSSTAALSLIFVPFWACFFASVIGMVCWVASRVRARMGTRNGGSGCQPERR